MRDECRGAHYKPEFAMPEITAAEPAERRRQAEAWCDRFEENNRKWLKIDDRRLVARRRAADELRGGRHVADPAAAATVRHGRRRGDRRGVERTRESAGTAESQANRPSGGTRA